MSIILHYDTPLFVHNIKIIRFENTIACTRGARIQWKILWRDYGECVIMKITLINIFLLYKCREHILCETYKLWARMG